VISFAKFQAEADEKFEKRRGTLEEGNGDGGKAAKGRPAA
jgi:hypothetical protein